MVNIRNNFEQNWSPITWCWNKIHIATIKSKQRIHSFNVKTTASKRYGGKFIYISEAKYTFAYVLNTVFKIGKDAGPED